MATGAEPPPTAVLNTPLPSADRPEDEIGSDLAERLAQVVETAVEASGIDSVGLMLLDQHDALRTAGFTSFPASLLEQVQAEIGEGPGIDASARAESVPVADLAEEPRYAALWRRVSSTGVRAVLASPVRVWGSVIGNLNAMRNQAHRWTETEIRANEAYARVISVTLELAVQAVDSARNGHPAEPGPRLGAGDSASAVLDRET